MSAQAAALSASGSAFGFALFQFVYSWVGEGEVSRATAVAVAATAFLFAWWARCLQEAGRGDAPALGGLCVLAFGWSFVGTGLVALGVCLPSCEPYEWFIGIGNTVFGGAAAGASGWAIHEQPVSIGPQTGLISAALTVIALTLTAVTS